MKKSIVFLFCFLLFMLYPIYAKDPIFLQAQREAPPNAIFAVKDNVGETDVMDANALLTRSNAYSQDMMMKYGVHILIIPLKEDVTIKIDYVKYDFNTEKMKTIKTLHESKARCVDFFTVREETIPIYRVTGMYKDQKAEHYITVDGKDGDDVIKFIEPKN